LLDEFALAVQEKKRLTLTLAGAGQEEMNLRRRIKELKLEDHIFISGWQEKLDSYYETCAAVIFPSLWMEAFGLVMTEAMSHARPIIGSNRGSPLWLIEDKQTGLIFDPLKKGDLAEKMLQVAGNIEWIKQVGKNGYDKLQRFSDNGEVLRQIVREYEDALRDALRDGAKSAPPQGERF